MKANDTVYRLLLEITALQRQKIAVAYKLGWLSQTSYGEAERRLIRNVKQGRLCMEGHNLIKVRGLRERSAVSCQSKFYAQFCRRNSVCATCYRQTCF